MSLRHDSRRTRFDLCLPIGVEGGGHDSNRAAAPCRRAKTRAASRRSAGAPWGPIALGESSARRPPPMSVKVATNTHHAGARRLPREEHHHRGPGRARAEQSTGYRIEVVSSSAAGTRRLVSRIRIRTRSSVPGIAKRARARDPNRHERPVAPILPRSLARAAAPASGSMATTSAPSPERSSPLLARRSVDLRPVPAGRTSASVDGRPRDPGRVRGPSASLIGRPRGGAWPRCGASIRCRPSKRSALRSSGGQISLSMELCIGRCGEGQTV